MAALCIQRWAPYWKNRVVYVYSDNKCTVSIINKCSCKDSSIMALLRTNFWLAAHYNIHIKAVYMPGYLNRLADTISRLHEGLGRLLQLESMYNEWHLCHRNVSNAFDCISFANHMSLSSVFALQVIRTWRLQKWPWMRSFNHSSERPFRPPLKGPTGRSLMRTSHFARTMDINLCRHPPPPFYVI
jgi:hypothetical protein